MLKNKSKGILKRWNIYFKEMYPLLSRLFVGFLLFFEIYFLVILTNGHFEFNIGISEFVGAITIFSFLLLLRIADDFKDYKTDLKLFPDRPLPSRKGYKNRFKNINNNNIRNNYTIKYNFYE